MPRRLDTLTTCVHCQSLTDDAVEVPTGIVGVCPSCLNRYYTECSGCGALNHRMALGCRNGCRDCPCGCNIRIPAGPGQQRPPRLINNYSYKPEPVFFGDGPLFLGVEIEVDTDHASRERERVAQYAQDTLGDLAYLKSDGSLDYGFEIVTHPMSYQYAMAEFPWDILPQLAEDGARATPQTGIHVHVSRAGFSGRSHMYRWMKFIYRNEPRVVRLAGRRSDRWAPFSPQARGYVKEYIKGPREASYESLSVGRYQAINVLNEATLELRIFAGSLEPAVVQADLAFAAASVEYTRTLTANQVVREGGWTWRKFRQWATERPEYLPLTERITRRLEG